jgi:hypothetical protein
VHLVGEVFFSSFHFLCFVPLLCISHPPPTSMLLSTSSSSTFSFPQKATKWFRPRFYRRFSETSQFRSVFSLPVEVQSKILMNKTFYQETLNLYIYPVIFLFSVLVSSLWTEEPRLWRLASLFDSSLPWTKS